MSKRAGSAGRRSGAFTTIAAKSRCRPARDRGLSQAHLLAGRPQAATSRALMLPPGKFCKRFGVVHKKQGSAQRAGHIAGPEKARKASFTLLRLLTIQYAAI